LKERSSPLIDDNLLIQKFPGKGGWTYVALPTIPQSKENRFGWVTVKGSIDRYTLSHYNLMPMGNGCLFLPLNAKVRKIIQKKEGDYVQVTLHLDTAPISIPDEIIQCFKQEIPETYNRFKSLSEAKKKQYIDWIYSAKTDETKANRIAKMINAIENLNESFIP